MLYIMKSYQLNIRTSKALLKELDTLVNQGLFRSRTEAVNEGIRLLIRRYKALKLAEKINSIADKNLGEKSLTETLFSIRDEEE